MGQRWSTKWTLSVQSVIDWVWVDLPWGTKSVHSSNISPNDISPNDISTMPFLPYLPLGKGWFTRDSAVCVFLSGLCQRRDRKFFICFEQYNHPLRKTQIAVSSLNRPWANLTFYHRRTPIDRISDWPNGFWSTWTYLFKHTKRTPFVKPRKFGQSEIRSIRCLPLSPSTEAFCVTSFNCYRYLYGAMPCGDLSHRKLFWPGKHQNR